MHSAPILAPRPISDALHRVQWQRTIAGYIVDVIEPIAMLALIGLALGCRSRSSHKGFLIFASIALALMAARRLNNAIVAWTDLQDLATYAWLASVKWVPAVAAWTLARNPHGACPLGRSVARERAVVLAGAPGLVGAPMTHSAKRDRAAAVRVDRAVRRGSARAIGPQRNQAIPGDSSRLATNLSRAVRSVSCSDTDRRAWQSVSPSAIWRVPRTQYIYARSSSAARGVP
jgi:hypothetical protein